jgi:hypothetical protein
MTGDLLNYLHVFNKHVDTNCFLFFFWWANLNVNNVIHPKFSGLNIVCPLWVKSLQTGPSASCAFNLSFRRDLNDRHMQSSRLVLVLPDMTSKIWADFTKD